MVHRNYGTRDFAIHIFSRALRFASISVIRVLYWKEVSRAKWPKHCFFHVCFEEQDVWLVYCPMKGKPIESRSSCRNIELSDADIDTIRSPSDNTMPCICAFYKKNKHIYFNLFLLLCILNVLYYVRSPTLCYVIGIKNCIGTKTRQNVGNILFCCYILTINYDLYEHHSVVQMRCGSF